MANLMIEAIKTMSNAGTVIFYIDGRQAEISIENDGTFYCAFEEDTKDDDTRAYTYTSDEDAIIEKLAELYKYTVLEEADTVLITSAKRRPSGTIKEDMRKVGTKKLYSFFVSVLNKKVRKKIIASSILSEYSEVTDYEPIDSIIQENGKLNLEFEEMDTNTLIKNIEKQTQNFERQLRRAKNLDRDLKSFNPDEPLDDYMEIVDEWDKFFYPVKAENLKISSPEKAKVKEELAKIPTPQQRSGLMGIDMLYRAGIGYEFMDERTYPINPAIGRDKEIRKLGSILLTPSYSAILLGNPGVGKTAIVEGLAYAVENSNMKNRLESVKILKTTPAQIVSGSKYVGEFERKMESLVNFLKNNPNVVLYIDEFHSAVGAGTGENSNNDILNILKPYIENGTIKLIAATTNEDYNNVLKNDPAFTRRLIPINVEEPDTKTLRYIVEGSIDKYEQLTSINFVQENRDEVIDILIDLTDKSHRVYREFRYNPSLVLSIIEASFRYSSYDDCDSVDIKHLCEAINDSEGIYEVAREEYCNLLKGLPKSKTYTKTNNLRVLNNNQS